jgi:hypothetical protein
MSSSHVFVAINHVQAALSKIGIEKGQDNRQQGFKFRGIDDVLNTIAGLLAKNNLVIVPQVVERNVQERTTPKGTKLYSVTVKVDYMLVSAVDATSIKATAYGEAMDSGDKATNKAMSAAYKYMAIQTFCIPTEGDNDADATTHEPIVDTQPEPRDMTAQIRECTTEKQLLDLWMSMTPAERLLHAAVKDAKKAALTFKEPE